MLVLPVIFLANDFHEHRTLSCSGVKKYRRVSVLGPKCKGTYQRFTQCISIEKIFCTGMVLCIHVVAYGFINMILVFSPMASIFYSYISLIHMF